MARYLVVAYQTADSPELAAALGDLARRDDDSTFVLVVPATPVEHLASWTEGEGKALAREAGERARAALQEAGVALEDVVIGDPNPLYAVGDELGERPFDSIVVSTLPKGASRWLKLDVVSRLRRTTGLPVSHVEAAAPVKEKGGR